MSKRTAFGLLLVALVAGPAIALERLGDPTQIQPSVAQELPSIATEFVRKAASWSNADLKLALMRAVSRWLTATYDFPSTLVLPHVVQVTRARISEMRYGPLCLRRFEKMSRQPMGIGTPLSRSMSIVSGLSICRKISQRGHLPNFRSWCMKWSTTCSAWQSSVTTVHKPGKSPPISLSSDG